MKWKIVKDMRFFNGQPKDGYLILQKGSVYNQVSHANYDIEIRDALYRKKKTSSRNERFVILNAEGMQRMFVIGVDVVPYSRGVGRRR